jgi:cysteinyl-tRNA synthetase
MSYVVQLGSALLARDAAYVRNGSVYARTAQAYQGAGLTRDDAITLATEYHDAPEDPQKDDPLDVVIWRSVAGGDHEDVFWPSPWGPGRPGWHAECAAMVLALFGASVDVHCGGADLAYPHHACERVLAESATGVAPFARAWLRAGTVQLDGAKMAKSSGNLVLVEDLLRDYPAAAIRLLCLNRPWAQAWSFQRDDLDSAATLLDELYSAAGTSGSDSVNPGVADALLADLDVPHALNLAVADGAATARTVIDVLALG